MSDPAMTTEAWAIKGKGGKLSDFAMPTKKALHSIVSEVMPHLPPAARNDIKKGYRAVRVRITEIEDE